MLGFPNAPGGFYGLLIVRFVAGVGAGLVAGMDIKLPYPIICVRGGWRFEEWVPFTRWSQGQFEEGEVRLFCDMKGS